MYGEFLSGLLTCANLKVIWICKIGKYKGEHDTIWRDRTLVKVNELFKWLLFQHYSAQLYFFVFFKNIWRTSWAELQFFFWNYLHSCFRLLVASTFDFKTKVDSLACIFHCLHIMGISRFTFDMAVNRLLTYWLFQAFEGLKLRIECAVDRWCNRLS